MQDGMVAAEGERNELPANGGAQGPGKQNSLTRDAGALFVSNRKGNGSNAGSLVDFHRCTPLLLSLPFAFAALGWEYGPIMLVLDALVTFYAYNVLSVVIEELANSGRRHLRFRDLAEDILGKWFGRGVGLIQLLVCVGAAVALSLLGGSSIKVSRSRLTLVPGKDSSRVMEPTKITSERDLVPAIWQELPTELLILVLTKLPASALKKFCSVSRLWNALIQSPEFAQQCNSVESVVCYFSSVWYANGSHHPPYIARPNLKTGSWERRWVYVDVGKKRLEEDYALIAADHGLFCYRVFNRNHYEDEVILCVHNPVTDFSKRIIVPYSFEEGMVDRRSDSVLGGLIMDPRTGSYTVVVALIDAVLTRETFIYDSSLDSWTISAAISPALGRDDNFMDTGEITEWKIDRSIRCGDELFWLIGENTDDGWLRTLIQYNMKLDTWSSVSKLWPYRYEYTPEELEQDADKPMHLASFGNQVFLVNFNPSPEKTRLVSEFINLVPGMRKFGVEQFADLLEQTGCTPSFDGFRPNRAVAGSGTWFIECIRDTGEGPGTYEWNIFAFRQNGSVIRLPRLDVEYYQMTLCSLAATFKAFV
ncbi:hypothetical protein R1sor_004240 [Riccia sorocarpa]|uniref:F-box domain-containing protein n=1 Tax=Riccia sorocarpa TaxID=122646 RepID=A0ABD3H485_9MARC